jgi:CheY-like chemotaxis protein
MRSSTHQNPQIRHIPPKDQAVFSESGRPVPSPRESHASACVRPVRILLAEDNPADVFLFRLALTDYAVPTELTVVEDGAAVLDLLLGGGNFDILILDLNLPKVGGEEVLWKLTAASGDARPAIPVVVFSSLRVMPRDAPGADACVEKPEGLDDYLKAVQRICDEWLSPTATE